ncbi:hypothetical protein [Streptomyces sp. NPDC001970]
MKSISAAAQDLELFLSGRGVTEEGTYSTGVLRGVAPFVVLLHRRLMMLSSLAPPGRQSGDRYVHSYAALLPRLHEAALAAGDRALAQLLDWTHIAWTGRSGDGTFFTERTLPSEVQFYLGELAAEPGPVMVRATGSLVLRDHAERLRSEADRLAGVDRTFTRFLFVEPVGAILHDLSRGVVDDHGLLDHSPEALAAHANAERRRQGSLQPIPTNGLRWPVIIKNTAAVCDRVRRLLEVAADHRWDYPAPGRPPLDSLPAELRPVLEAAVHLDTEIDDPLTENGDSWLTKVAEEVLKFAKPGQQHLLALVARAAGAPDELTEPALAAITEIRRRADDTFGALTLDPDGTGEDLHSLILDALARGDVSEAGQGLDMLEDVARRAALEGRLAAVRAAAVAGIADEETAEAVQRHLRTAALYVEQGEVQSAEHYVADAEAALPSGPPESGNDAEPALESRPPTLGDGSRVLVAADENELSARVLAAYRSGRADEVDREQALEDLHALGTTGPVHLVVSIARELLHVAPSAVVDLTDRALERARPALRPALWQLQYDALRQLGDGLRAERVFYLGHPPLPPPDLPDLSPAHGASWLQPRLQPVAGKSPGKAETGIDEPTLSPQEEAERCARALEAGNNSTLGAAVGWAVAAGRPRDALNLYRRFGRQLYLNAEAAWNVAAAYAAAGFVEESVRSLTVFRAIVPGRIDPSQRRALEQFLSLHDPSTVLLPPQSALQLYAAGRVDEASLGLEQLLANSSKSPGAFLLLRILREQGDLERARQAVDRIESAGGISWRHHVELARNAIEAGDLDLAEERLGRAAALDADDSWTAPLVRRLQALRGQPSSAPATGVGVGGRASAAVDAKEGRRVFRDRLQAGDLDGLLESVRRTPQREPWVVGALVLQLRTLRFPVPDAAALDTLTLLVREERDENVSRDFANWLMGGGRYTAAVRVLQDCVAWTAPDRLPRVLFLRESAARKAGITTATYDPPLPPSQASSPARALDPDMVPRVYLQEIIEPQASIPSIHEAQRLPSHTPAGVVADAWVRAVRDEQSLALGNAMGTLVIAQRPAEAIELYRSVAHDFWLGAAAAWNLGCAFAAAGHAEEAAATFAYHARVTPRQYQAQQLHNLRALFSSLGRPVPPTAGSHGSMVRVAPEPARPEPGPRGQAVNADAEEAARRIARCRNEPSDHTFYLAGGPVRRAMRAGTSADVTGYVATMRSLWAQVPQPKPKGAAEMASVLTVGGHREEAWNMLLEWIDRSGAAAALLAPAVRLAGELHRERILHKRLEKHHTAARAGFELNLSLAKLAQREGDEAGVLTYTDLALRKKPTSAEAATLRDNVGGRRRELPTLGQGVVHGIIHSEVSDAEAVQRLVIDYGAEADALRVKALSWFQPKTDRAALARSVPAEFAQDALPALEAVEREDWERAAQVFVTLLDQHPREEGLAQCAAACLIEADMKDDARSVAEVFSHLSTGVRILVQLACTQGNYTQAADLLALRGDGARTDREEVAAEAGLIAHLCKRHADAARLLLEFARRQRPGTAEMHLALAVVLAHREQATDLTGEALALLRRPEPDDLDALLSWAFAEDSLEVLNHHEVPALEAEHLDRVAAHLEANSDRLLRFVRTDVTRPGASPAAVRRERDARLRISARLLEARGLVLEAHRDWLARVDEAADRLEVLREMLAFCARVSYAEGYHKAAFALRDAGSPVSEEEFSRGSSLISEKDPAALPPETARFVDDTCAADPAALPVRLREVADRLAELAGPQDARALERLGELWHGLATRLADDSAATHLVGAPRRESHASFVETGLREQAGLADNLISQALHTASHAVSRSLGARWDRIARAHIRRGAGGRQPLTLRVQKATRMGDGPVEVQVLVRAGREPLSAVTVGVKGAGPEAEVAVDGVEAGGTQTCLLVVPGERSPITVEGMASLTDGTVTTGKAVTDVVSVPPEQVIKSRFRAQWVGPEMFVGRTKELQELSRHYENTTGTNTGSVFMIGACKAGKSSLLRRLAEIRPVGASAPLPPDQWRTPRAFPVLLAANSVDVTDDSPIADIAKAVRLTVRQAFVGQAPDVGPFAGRSVLDFQEWWYEVRRGLWPGQSVVLLLIIDGFPDLLKQFEREHILDRALGKLYGLKDSGDVEMLFGGASTYTELSGLLAGTSFLNELNEPLLLGPFDEKDTLMLFHQGFPEPVEAMPAAVLRVWEVTQGHPLHIHLIGNQVTQFLREKRRTVVDVGLVDEAATWLSTRDDAVIGMLGHSADREATLSLLAEVTPLIAHGHDAATFKARFDDSSLAGLDGLRELGLLVRKGGTWAWANHIMRSWAERRWPVDLSESLGLGWNGTEQDLKRARYAIKWRSDSTQSLPTCHVEHGDSKQMLEAVLYLGQREVLLRVHDAISHTDYQVPQSVAPCGDWSLFHRIEGPSLQRKLEDHRKGIEVSPAQAVKWIVEACDTLSRLKDRLTHGDIRPENLRLKDFDPDQLYVVGWGFGTAVGSGMPLLQSEPSEYWTPESRAEGRRIPTPADDAFALSAILYRFLHPKGEAPYPATPTTGHGPRSLPDHLGVLGMRVFRGVGHVGDRYETPEALGVALTETMSKLDPGDEKPDKDRSVGQLSVAISPIIAPSFGINATGNDESIKADTGGGSISDVQMGKDNSYTTGNHPDLHN